MTNDGNNTLVYDAENRVLSASNGGGSGTYTYDGNNLRVKKVSGSTTTVYIFSGSKVIAEYDNGAAIGSPSREYIYSGSALLAKIDSSGTKYYHQDHLSNRVVTDSSGNTVATSAAERFPNYRIPLSSRNLDRSVGYTLQLVVPPGSPQFLIISGGPLKTTGLDLSLRQDILQAQPLGIVQNQGRVILVGACPSLNH